MPGYLLDTGVWVAFAFPQHPGHTAAREALMRATLSQPAVMCRAAEQGFLRLATTAALFTHYGVPDMTNHLALQFLQTVLANAHVVWREESPGLTAHWHQMAAVRNPAPKVWMDAYLAAFAITGALTLVTLDKGFRMYARYGLDYKVLTASPRGPTK